MKAWPQRRHVWGAPLALAASTLAGLLCALLGEQLIWKAIGWIMLGVPVAVGLWLAQPLGDRG